MSPRTRTRIKTHALAGGCSLVLSALLLAGCSGFQGDIPEPTKSSDEQTQEEKSDAELDEVQIKLKDGRTVTCVKYGGFNGRGGLSCDWDNVKEPAE